MGDGDADSRTVPDPLAPRASVAVSDGLSSVDRAADMVLGNRAGNLTRFSTPGSTSLRSAIARRWQEEAPRAQSGDDSSGRCGSRNRSRGKSALPAHRAKQRPGHDEAPTSFPSKPADWVRTTRSRVARSRSKQSGRRKGGGSWPDAHG